MLMSDGHKEDIFMGLAVLAVAVSFFMGSRFYVVLDMCHNGGLSWGEGECKKTEFDEDEITELWEDAFLIHLARPSSKNVAVLEMKIQELKHSHHQEMGLAASRSDKRIEEMQGEKETLEGRLENEKSKAGNYKAQTEALDKQLRFIKRGAENAKEAIHAFCLRVQGDITGEEFGKCEKIEKDLEVLQ